MRYDIGMPTAEIMRPVLVRLLPDQLDQLRHRATLADRSLAAEIRRAVRTYLEAAA
jgi:hypothetical protein